MSMTPRSHRRRASLADVTGQGWKITSGIVCFVITGIATLIEQLGPRETMVAASLVAAAAGVLAVVAIWSVRCRKCRRSLGLWTFSRPMKAHAPEVLPSMPACPYCRYTGQEDRDRRGGSGEPERGSLDGPR